ncbi:MAG: hypothetical protein Q9M36_15555 [Sulfurovum sp.]|nr:hypothetical protein [Sulfurovum sp.]
MNGQMREVQDSINTAKNVEQIRDIIFGTQTKEFDTRITQLSDNLNELETKLTKMIYDSHMKLKTDSERSFTMLEKTVENIRMTIAKDSISMKEQSNLRELNLQNKMTAQNQLLVRKLNNLKHLIDEEKRTNQENLYRIKDEIQTTLDLELQSLSDNKLSRNKMAEMFLDIAMRLQGETPTQILDEGIQTGN